MTMIADEQLSQLLISNHCHELQVALTCLLSTLLYVLQVTCANAGTKLLAPKQQ